MKIIMPSGKEIKEALDEYEALKDGWHSSAALMYNLKDGKLTVDVTVGGQSQGHSYDGEYPEYNVSLYYTISPGERRMNVSEVKELIEEEAEDHEMYKRWSEEGEKSYKEMYGGK